MEESPYTLPNSIPPSLVVFSQSGYGDPIRMQRPFSSQVSDSKDALNSLPTLSPSSFGLRPMDSFPGLSAQLVHLQNPFLHPALESHRLQFGSSSGAFRPIAATSTSAANQLQPPPPIISSSSASSNNNNNNNNDNGNVSQMKSIPSAFSAPALSISSRRKLDSIVESVMESRNREAAAAVASSSSSSSSSSNAMNLEKSFVNGNHHHHHQHSQQQQQHRRSNSPVNHNSLGQSAHHLHHHHQHHHHHLHQQQHHSKEERNGENSEERDENLSPNSELTDRSTPEDLTPPPQQQQHQHQHSSKRRRKGNAGGSGSSGSSGCDGLACPVCKMSLRPHELEAHLLGEVEQLMRMSRLRRTQQLPQTQRDEASTSSLDSPNSSTKKDSLLGSELSQDSRWDTYHRIRANRHSRLRIKTRRRREESGGGTSHVTCPVCQIPLQGTNEQFSAHVEACLRKNGDMLDEDEPVDIEGDGDANEMDEYNWIHSRRIAHSRNNPNSYSATALNMTTNSRRRDEDNDMEVVVDGDETVPYGQPQYTEADVKAAAMAASNQPSSSDPANNTQRDIKNKWNNENESSESNGEDLSTNAGSSLNNHESSGNGNNNVNDNGTSKSRGHDLEKKSEFVGSSGHDSNSHCILCMEKYKKPVVSVSCWHVHCEHCWLKALYSQKLCPQCNAITSPSDLRRIFL